MNDTALTTLLGPGAPSGRWALDPDRSHLGFRSTSGWGLIKVKGQFSAASGQLTVADDGSTSGEVVIDAASVATGIKKRDKHLRSKDILAVEAHPTIVYTVNDVVPGKGSEARVSGTLEVAGKTQPLDLDVRVSERDDAGVTIATETEIDRSLWGVDFKKLGMTRMTTPIELVARFQRPAV